MSVGHMRRLGYHEVVRAAEEYKQAAEYEDRIAEDTASIAHATSAAMMWQLHDQATAEIERRWAEVYGAQS